MFCPNCGQPQFPGYSFCTRCGCKLIQPENISIPTQDVPAADPVPAQTICDQVANVVTEETTVSEESVTAEATPSNSYELPGEDPAAIPDESGTYAPPAQPYIPPYPQYGYPGAAPQYPPYPYYGSPIPPYPQMSGPLYTPNPYVPYPAYPVMPQYPTPTPMPQPPVVRDAPPTKVGRRRVPVIIMAVLLILGLLLFFFGPDLPVYTDPENAAQTQSETPWFHNEDGTLYFDADLYTGPAELTIPETVDGQPVVFLADECFADSEAITTVVLPATLEEIGDGAFANCTALRGIFIPDGVKRIGSGAFENCTALEAIHIPSSIASIGRDAFWGCSKLAHIMYDGTFADWNNLYSSYISGKTKVYCSDGTFPQGKITP